jgi:2,3-bisphosphoglycerate-dependent phosphoglycerate mutase
MVVLRVGKKSFEIGAASFLKSWFSSIDVRLERENWGSRFPAIMRELYGGRLRSSRVQSAANELELITQEFALHPPSDVVWDFENRSAQPPWGTAISAHITSLANYFVTSDGKDLHEVLRAAFAEAQRNNLDITIQ